MKNRIASIKRKTAETDIELTLNLDGEGRAQVEGGVSGQRLDHGLPQHAPGSNHNTALPALHGSGLHPHRRPAH